MGWPCPGLLFPVSCLILVWVTGSGSIKVLNQPTCFSDYLNVSTCEWQLDRPVGCGTELHLSYWLDFEFFENRTCVPKNSADTACVCYMLTDDLIKTDTYRLDLWAGQQLLWGGSFQPSEHVKPRAPGNLTVHGNISNTWLLTWSNPYPPGSYLYKGLTYLVNISREDNPADFKVHNVTYMDPILRLAASTLKPRVSYSARVKARAQNYNSMWSEWSPSAKWHNDYQVPLVQHLHVGVSISCVLIVVICLSCYFGIIKIKKVWWDQIPNPARSPLVAVIIQDSQVSPWEKRSRGQEATKCPRWKTCLTKLLPCLLEHGIKRDQDFTKAAIHRNFQSPGKQACLMEANKRILCPENISVVRCVELFEAPVASGEKEEEEEDNGNLCTSPEGSGVGFQDGREGIMAQLTESLFLDLLGAEAGGLGQLGPEVSGFPLPAEAQVPLTCIPGQEPSLASWACTPVPTVVADNPAYRSFSDFQSESPSPTELEPDPERPVHLEEEVNTGPWDPQPEPESWEQVLRQRVLQLGAVVVPPSVTASGYRQFEQVVEQARDQDLDSGVRAKAGYTALSSLLTSNATCTATSGPGAGSGDGGYKPFQSLIPDCPQDPATVPRPFFTFGLDMEPSHGAQDSFVSISSPECLGLEPAKGEDRQKPTLTLEQAPESPQDDLGSGIVYSALTCHLCGRLKQCHSQKESGQAHAVASPCCGCCCRDRASLLGSPVGTPNPTSGGLLSAANLTPASLVPLGVSTEGKALLSCQPTSAQSSSQMPNVADLASTDPLCMRVS
ncbi:interleukin-4 receptor subunit alpha [Castor canadensis]|uniref:interleukin-4 receptor subunit alpha n=1 Tax=Castor canadensis TaxID=51338 RepID=UPI003D175DE0